METRPQIKHARGGQRKSLPRPQPPSGILPLLSSYSKQNKKQLGANEGKRVLFTSATFLMLQISVFG
jgi:hypothetical protein